MAPSTHMPEQLKGHVCHLPQEGMLVVAQSLKDSPVVDSYFSSLRKTNNSYKRIDYRPSNAIEVLLKKHEQHLLCMETDSNAEKLLQSIFEHAAKVGASDVHAILGTKCCEIKVRVDGDISPHPEYPEVPRDKGSNALVALLQSVSGDQSHASWSDSKSQSARIKKGEFLPENVHAIRIQKVPHANGQYAVARLLYATSEEGNVRERLLKLGFSEDHARSLEFLIRRPHGTIIVGGGTGHGKSTTLKNIMEAMAESIPGRNYISVEDPPEYPIAGTIQIDASKESEEEDSNAFAAAIVDALRLDPDVLMIGEIRDERSAHATVRAAMSGHLVLSTIHANTATNILTRFSDLLDGAGIGDSRAVLSDVSVLSGLVSQRLVKKLCPVCSMPLSAFPKDKRTPELEAVLGRIKKLVANSEQYRDSIRIHNPEGCDRCRYGHSGRTVVAEVIVLDAEFQKEYREHGIERARHYWLHSQDKQEAGVISNGKSMAGHAIQLILEGKIDPVEAEKTIGYLNYDAMFDDGQITSGEIKSATGTEDTL